MSKKKPLILVTNDDGITAPGIRTLIEVMNTIGDVVVVAPDAPQSAMGHAITINDIYIAIKLKWPKANHKQNIVAVEHL
jgi:5'-nucleotidase